MTSNIGSKYPAQSMGMYIEVWNTCPPTRFGSQVEWKEKQTKSTEGKQVEFLKTALLASGRLVSFFYQMICSSTDK